MNHKLINFILAFAILGMILFAPTLFISDIILGGILFALVGWFVGWLVMRRAMI